MIEKRKGVMTQNQYYSHDTDTGFQNQKSRP